MSHHLIIQNEGFSDNIAKFGQLQVFDQYIFQQNMTIKASSAQHEYCNQVNHEFCPK